jgi:hypothetical protein
VLAEWCQKPLADEPRALKIPRIQLGEAELGEPTSGLEPLSCSLRVIIHMLQGFARGCKSCIFGGLSPLRVAACCTVLRSRWCQSGINRRMPASRSYSLVHASEVRPAPHEGRHHPAYPRPVLTLDALYEPKHCRWHVQGVGLATPLTGVCKATQETCMVRSKSTVAGEPS